MADATTDSAASASHSSNGVFMLTVLPGNKLRMSSLFWFLDDGNLSVQGLDEGRNVPHIEYLSAIAKRKFRCRVR